MKKQQNYEIVGDFCYFETTKGCVGIIDKKYEHILKDKFFASYNPSTRNFYIKRGYDSKRIHRLVYSEYIGRDLEKHEQIDHIDKNPLNNSVSNLRIVSNRQNCRNQRLPKNNTSGYRGVYPQGKKFYSAVYGEYFGIFDNKIDAALMSDKAMRWLGYDDSCLNFSIDETLKLH